MLRDFQETLSMTRFIIHFFRHELPQGKDAILDALAALCSSCHTAMSAEDSGMPSVILNAVCAACSRKSKLYREAAFSCLQQVSISLLYPDLYVKLKFVASGYSKAFTVCGPDFSLIKGFLAVR